MTAVPVTTKSLTPSAIGREFVRRYYTVLNESPTELYRFYCNESVFVHDGADSLFADQSVYVEGKEAICNLMNDGALKYRNCFTKINNIDTTITLNDGLLIQVMGEISNDGQPMRPFSQTFVLTKQSAMKYYVQNDIFRYQDLLPASARTTADAHSGEPSAVETSTFMNTNGPLIANEEITSVSNDVNGEFLQGAATYPACDDRGANPPDDASVDLGVECGEYSGELNSVGSSEPPVVDEVIIDLTYDSDTSYASAETEMGRNDTGVSGTISTDAVSEGPETASNATEDRQISTECLVEPPNKDDDGGRKEGAKEVPTADAEQATEAATKEKEIEAEIVCEEGSAASDPLAEGKTEIKILTYADYLKCKGKQPTLEPSEKLKDLVSGSSFLSDWVKVNGNDPNEKRAPASKVAKESSRPRERTYFGQRTASFKSENPGKGGGSSHDQLQVFIGNICHDAPEDGLRRIFERYGKITRFRVHSNPNRLWVPNYAFVSYETTEAVQKCLKDKDSIYFPEDSIQKLNINAEAPPSQRQTRSRNSSSRNGGREKNTFNKPRDRERDGLEFTQFSQQLVFTNSNSGSQSGDNNQSVTKKLAKRNDKQTSAPSGRRAGCQRSQ